MEIVTPLKSHSRKNINSWGRTTVDDSVGHRYDREKSTSLLMQGNTALVWAAAPYQEGCRGVLEEKLLKRRQKAIL